MRTLLAALALILAAASSAFARDIASTVQQLDTDIAARIAAIGTPATKESKGLTKARTKLSTYHGGNKVPDFKILAAAGKLVVTSKTSDPAIVADINAVLQAMCDCATVRQGLADQALADLLLPAHRAIVRALVVQATAAITRAKALLPTNRVAAGAFAIKAYDVFGFAVGTSQTFAAQEAGSPPPSGLSVVPGVNSLSLSNAGPSFYDISKIQVFADVTTGGAPLKSYTGNNAKSIVKGLFSVKLSNRILPATSFDLTPILLQMIPAGTANGRIVGRLWITLKGQKFFVADFDVTAP